MWGFDGKLEGKKNFENLGIDGQVTLKYVFKKYDGRMWT
jgi:hypothetical protein